MVRRAGAVRVVELTAARLADASSLMAVEHADSGVGAVTGFGDEIRCRRALSDLLSGGFDGYAALIDGELVGVMCVRAVAPVAFVPAHGLVIRPSDDDPTSIAVAMLAAASPGLVDDGVVRITVDHLAVETVRLALHDAGFAGGAVFAVRASTPLPTDDTQVRVRTASIADLDSIAELSGIELQHRYQPPIYAFEPAPSDAETREMHAELFASGGTHLIASLDGRDVGLLTIEVESPAPRLCPHGAHIGPTATRPDARGRGVGRALVAAALDIERDRGHQQLSVDFESANPLSRPFWLELGFTPTGYRQRRVIKLN